MDLSIFFAGTAGSVPTARRGLPALLIRRGGDRLLFDCGEGTQRQLVASVGLPEIDDVFVTHYHADHWLGLPGMLKTFDLRRRELLGSLRRVYGRLSYPLELVELAPGEGVRRDDYSVAAFAVAHRVSALGYALYEDTRPGQFDPALAEELGVAPGPGFGRLQRGETVDGVRPDQVMGPAREGRKVVISGDTAPCPALTVAAHRADVLVCEATFADEERERAAETAHATATQAAQVARDADVGLLALTHLSTRYGGRELRDEARAVFANTVVPRDFDAIDVPLPERGPPQLVRWEDPVRT